MSKIANRTDPQLVELATKSLKKMANGVLEENKPFGANPHEPGAAVALTEAQRAKVDRFERLEVDVRTLELAPWEGVDGEGWGSGVVYEDAQKNVFACIDSESDGSRLCYSIPTEG